MTGHYDTTCHYDTTASEIIVTVIHKEKLLFIMLVHYAAL